MTPLRQFKGVPTEVIRKAEGKQFVSQLYSDILLLLIPSPGSTRYFDLTPEIGELIGRHS